MNAADAPIEAVSRPAPPRWVMPAALAPIAVVVAAGWVAGSVWAELVREKNYALLIALSPVNRFLLLSANHLDAWQYYGIGLARHRFPDPFFFLLGHFYGAAALRWAAEGSPLAQKLVGSDGRGLEDPAHRKILYPLALLIPNNYVSLLCGAARIPVPAFIALNITGTIGRLILCDALAVMLEDEIADLATWIGANQKWITIVSVVLVLGAMVMQLRPSGQLRKLARLDRDSD